jgi:hypothetical protein
VVEEREHDPCGRQRAACAVCERQRHGPPDRREPQRPPSDPAEVDLVAGEEEEHPEAERGEEVGEVIRLGHVERLRPDRDPQQQLDDHHRHRDARLDQGGDRAGRRGGDDDHEEGRRVYLDHGRTLAPLP